MYHTRLTGFRFLSETGLSEVNVGEDESEGFCPVCAESLVVEPGWETNDAVETGFSGVKVGIDELGPEGNGSPKVEPGSEETDGVVSSWTSGSLLSSMSLAWEKRQIDTIWVVI